MPELPEVETIRKGLEKYLVGHKIENIEVKLAKMVHGDTSNVIGAKIEDVLRFGKGLVIELNNGYALAIHIKLTGQLVYVGKKAPAKIKVIKDLYSSLPNQWTHVIFHLDGNTKLYYNDFRTFGWIKIIKASELNDLEFFRDLGPEFFKDLTLEKFEEIITSSKSAIKPLVMDQKKMAGLGNIYTNDGFNLAKIDPSRKANTLSKVEIKRLFEAFETVLKKGLEVGGASELSYVNALGEEGGYQHHFRVYGRTGKECENCGGKIKYIKLGGRGTFYCPDCQK
jgi:formamidopyrimidine-DNA glycosylase